MKRILFFQSKFFGFALAVVFVLPLIFLGSRGSWERSEAVVYKIFFPIQKLLYQTSGEGLDYFSALFFPGQLIGQNQILQEDNLKLRLELASLREQARENETLRRQLAADLPKNFKFILTNVVGSCADNFSQCLFIDKGREDGVEVGASVALAGGILVGKIVEAAQGGAKVVLLSDPGSAINVLTQRTRASGVLRGDKGIGLILDMMPQDARVETGEAVITAGLENNFPKGLLVGEIEVFISSDVEAFKKAKVKPVAEFKNLEILFVATD
ncbi:MAG: rod shape-determining protein MreC [Candidatus Portnoybacteria bacterium]|nr:rod shape-determining protein MreC [Candidatus Portnoybacteria bacterium]